MIFWTAWAKIVKKNLLKIEHCHKNFFTLNNLEKLEYIPEL